MSNDVALDARLKNVDRELMEIVAAESERNIDLLGIHLRDARQLWYESNRLSERVFSKAALLLASAALESNLVYLSGVALRIAEQRQGVLNPFQIRSLKGVDEAIDENGNVGESPVKQPLDKRIQVVPALLARTFGREYTLKTSSAGFKKLVRATARRDAIVHPRWDTYVNELGSWEAAEAIDGIELYLESISRALDPYLFPYLRFLYTIASSDHHDLRVGHRTFGKRGPRRQLPTMGSVGFGEVLTREWTDSMFFIRLALEHDCEGDSQGSLLTRAALVLLYSMLEAQLTVVVQWRTVDKLSLFTEAEILFLNEYALGIGHDGDVWLDSDRQKFKKRIKAVPAILLRRLDGKDERIDLSREWGKDLIEGARLRDLVMHSAYGEPLARITKPELIRSAKAVFAYFEHLAGKSSVFEYMSILLRKKPDL